MSYKLDFDDHIPTAPVAGVMPPVGTHRLESRVRSSFCLMIPQHPGMILWTAIYIRERNG